MDDETDRLASEIPSTLLPRRCKRWGERTAQSHRQMKTHHLMIRSPLITAAHTPPKRRSVARPAFLPSPATEFFRDSVNLLRTRPHIQEPEGKGCSRGRRQRGQAEMSTAFQTSSPNLSRRTTG